MALCGTGWSLLGLMVFELVALVLRVTVVLNVGRRKLSIAMNPIQSAGVGTAPITAGETP